MNNNEKMSIKTAQFNMKDPDNFMEKFQRILNEAASPHDDLGGSPDYGDDADVSLGRHQIQFDKDPAETRAQLINLVRRHPELYDKNNQLYKNNAHKGILWQSIAKEMGSPATGKKVREQWSYMRRKYEEEYFSRKSGNAPTPTDPSKRHLFTYDQLSFLEPYITGERTTDSPNPPNPTATGLRFDPLLLDDVTNTNGHQTNGVEDGKVIEDPFGYRDSDRINLTDLILQLSNAAQRHQNGTNLFDDSTTNQTTNGRISGPPSLGHLPTSESIDVPKFSNRGSKKRKLQDSEAVSIAAPSSGGGTPPKCTASATAIRPMSPLNGTTAPMSMDVAQLNESVLRLSRCLEELMPRAAEDECELFGRQVTNDLRTLSPRSRLVARKRMADVLLDLLLEEQRNGTEMNDEELEKRKLALDQEGTPSPSD
ncbi:hypothetical protein M3Y98_00223300 [Aphelenchoides besseyi]|nr:hypothetical protein M3Y98_00223300 [Aphelenchoides besseyi]KAI6200500.1 hypothetical protein M3Y96_00740800 [Aphelenchoides besseyi]